MASGCLSSLLPLLVLVLAMSACWLFALEARTTEASAGAPEGRGVCSAACAYGSPRPQTAPQPRAITALNLAQTIYANEEVVGTALEAAADLMGPPVLPVTGMDTVSDAIALTLQEQYEAHEDGAPGEAPFETGPSLRKTRFQEVANAVSQESIAAAQPQPPRLKPLDDMLPARVWTPVFEGCASKFVENRCNFYQPNPQLFVTNLNELMSARSLLTGQVNLIEPLKTRQTLAQLLMLGVRSKKDPYTRATMTNDPAYTTCKTMAEQKPDFVVF